MTETTTVTVDQVRLQVLSILDESPDKHNPTIGVFGGNRWACVYIDPDPERWSHHVILPALRCVVGEWLHRFEGWSNADLSMQDGAAVDVLGPDGDEQSDYSDDVLAALQKAQEVADGVGSLTGEPRRWADVAAMLRESWGMGR